MAFRRVAFATIAAAFAACAFDWDAYDPRLAGAGGNAIASSSAGGAMASGSTASVGTGASGGGNTMMPGEFVCQALSSGWFRDAAAYSDGGFVVVGDFWDTLSLGGETLVSKGENDGLIARLGPNCEHVFSVRTGGIENNEGIESVAVTPDGNVVVVGNFQATADFGTFTETAAGLHDGFVAKLDPNGDFLWVRTFGSTGSEWGRAVTVDGAGNVYVAGIFEGTIDVGGAPLASVGSADVLVMKLDGFGNHVWSTSFGSTSWEHARSIEVSAAGQVIVVGQYRSAMDVGAIAVPHVGARDAFVVAFDTQGDPAWAHGFSSPDPTSEEYAQSVALRPNGNAVVVGRFDTSIAFGATQLTSMGGRDIFVAELDSQGDALWARRFGGPGGGDRGNGVAIDASGNIALVGSLPQSGDLGGGTVGSDTEENVYAAVYDPGGQLLWARLFSAPGSAYTHAFGVAFADDGDVLLTGFADGQIDFGRGPTADRPGFVVRLSN
jgi:beta-propeller repeat-containing protein